MRRRLESSKLFRKYVDESGAISYVFDHPDYPHTQSFYFTNPCATEDGRYIWMYCAFPPAGNALIGRTLGVVDLERDSFTHFPESMFVDASPIVDVVSGDAYFSDERGLYRLSPHPGSKPVLVAPLPDFLKGMGNFVKLATHHTFSPDRRRLCFDAQVGMRWFMGDIDLESGEYRLWREFDFCKNHAQLNPRKPDLMLYAEDEHAHMLTGEFFSIRRDGEGRLMRLWTLERGGEPRYIPPLFVEARHEWWSDDGEKIYYVDWNNGTVRYDTRSGTYTVVNPRGTWHAHCNAAETLFVADENEINGEKWYRGCPSRVHLYHAETGKYVNIVTENPALYTRTASCRYHIDPHPQFAVGERYVFHTATVTGKVSFAIAEVAQLLELIR